MKSRERGKNESHGERLKDWVCIVCIRTEIVPRQCLFYNSLMYREYRRSHSDWPTRKPLSVSWVRVARAAYRYPKGYSGPRSNDNLWKKRQIYFREIQEMQGSYQNLSRLYQACVTELCLILFMNIFLNNVFCLKLSLRFCF